MCNNLCADRQLAGQQRVGSDVMVSLKVIGKGLPTAFPIVIEPDARNPTVARAFASLDTPPPPLRPRPDHFRAEVGEHPLQQRRV
ncbi:MAG: hypothetical protein N3A53_02270, partial [Verrucomicrobiae bacterium]|nr:hypothetical protein [Verrucomicrobiae bacterium]